MANFAEGQLIGAMEPFHALFRTYENELSAERLQALVEAVKIINEETHLAVVVTDSLAYGQSKWNSDVDFTPMLIGERGKYPIEDLKSELKKRLPRVKLHIDHWWDHRDIFRAVDVIHTFSTFQPDPAKLKASWEEALLITDYHADLAIGGLLIGYDFDRMGHQLEQIVEHYPAMQKALKLRKRQLLLDKELGYVTAIRYQPYIRRLKQAPKFKALSPEEQQVKLAEIEATRKSLIQSVGKTS